MFIVFEGIDGSGKDTQIDLLAKKMQIPTLVTSEPTATYIGCYAKFCGTRKADNDYLAMLYTADRLKHCRDIIEPALKDGWVVLCNRYYLSTMAYQLGDNTEMIYEMNKKCLAPDIIFYLDISPEAAYTRIRKREGKEEETLERLKIVHNNYEIAIEECSFIETELIRIDANNDTDSVEKQIVSSLANWSIYDNIG